MKSTTEWASAAWLAKLLDGLDAVTGVTLVILFIYYLRKNRSGFKKTETIINRLMVFTIHIGMLTSLCGVLALIFVRSSLSSSDEIPHDAESPDICFTGYLRLRRILSELQQT